MFITTIIVAFVLAFVLGVLLGVFKKIFAVTVDPKVSKIREALSGANCGGCGFAGCDAFAQAVANGTAPVTGCVAGGVAVANSLSEIMGVSASGVEKKVAFIACGGTKECSLTKGVYNGVKTCVAANLTINGIKVCSYGCIGYGDCEQVCPFGAISMGSDGLPKVNKEKCTGCGKCAKTCPKHLFTLIPASTKGAIASCSNYSDNKPQIRKNCTAGCFKCGMCARKCPQQCIDVSSGIPKIDYTKCTSCGECVSACPDKVLHLL